MKADAGITLHIYHNSVSQRTKRVLSSDKKTTLYTFEASSFFRITPHATIRAGSPPGEPKKGSINLGNASIPVVEIEVQGLPRIQLMPTSSMSTAAHEYRSPALDGQKLKWRADGFFNLGDLVCEDQDQKVFAKLNKTNISISKTGTFEVTSEVADKGDKAVDEIVACGIALLELQRKLKGESIGNVEGALPGNGEDQHRGTSVLSPWSPVQQTTWHTASMHG